MFWRFKRLRRANQNYRANTQFVNRWSIVSSWSQCGHVSGCCKFLRASRSVVQHLLWVTNQMKNLHLLGAQDLCRLHFVPLCIFFFIWSDEYSEIMQFTIPGGRHAVHHAGLLQEAGAGRVLRPAAAATTASIEAKIFARIVLRNLEHHQLGMSTWTPSRGSSSNKQRPLHRWAAWPMQNQTVWPSEPFDITTVLVCADSDWRSSTEGITHNCEVTEWKHKWRPFAYWTFKVECAIF